MSNKILSYVIIIGWLIAFFLNKNNKPSNSLVRYYLKQGIGIFITYLIINIPLAIVSYVVPP